MDSGDLVGHQGTRLQPWPLLKSRRNHILEGEFKARGRTLSRRQP
jgi:hypothetical protein